MTRNLVLNWAVLAVSLFNTILLTWLGITVLLNSDRRRWGIWFAGGGLLLGAVFFVIHTAVLGQGSLRFDLDSRFYWWLVAMLSAITLPFIWYVVMLWYAGYWEDGHSSMHRRQRPWLFLTALLLVLGIGASIFVFAFMRFRFTQLAGLFSTLRGTESGIAFLIISFSIYLLMSIVLSLDALWRPGPSTRVMGQLARRRARPWLATASVGLFLVAILVIAVLYWLGQLAVRQMLSEVYRNSATTLARFDLLISLLISVVIILLGQAIVSYEVFTGKTLPRRGLRRHWQRTLQLATGYSVLVGGAITLEISPVFGLLLTALLMTLFYALVSWRSYVEREHLMKSLRPFIASQRLYDGLLSRSRAIEIDLFPAFETLCVNVLDTRRAYLAAAGLYAPLVSTPLTFPRSQAAGLPSLLSLIQQFDSSQFSPLPVDPAAYNGAVWAIPLWSERGMTGILLLGEKRSGGLYTQEEMEIAAITGERLIDTLAGAEMSRRLMTLQRQHLAQTQVVDQQTRRVLHDDILPDLHTAMISLSTGQENGNEAVDDVLPLLTSVHRQISDLLRELPTNTAPQIARFGLAASLRKVIKQEFETAFDRVEWQEDTAVSENLARIPSLSAEVIFYAAREAIRNAARYGRDPKSERPFVLSITVGQAANPADFGEDAIMPKGERRYQIQVHDNGVGFKAAAGFDSSNGQGLALHSTMMTVIDGTLSLTSAPGEYTCITLTYPANPE
jgi:signal transduction histidine kinase